ncbi:MAG: DUF2155 domain-containing protein [Alphaproteobacteria bacterium]|nr:MAG: DUF2155 domain-containing protein [Alphaproteobacteria bacterium]
MRIVSPLIILGAVTLCAPLAAQDLLELPAETPADSVDVLFEEYGLGDETEAIDVSPPAEVKAEPKPPGGNVAVLRAVDKITARVTDLDAPLNDVSSFGTLQITMRYCYKNPPEDTPEVTVFLEVTDHRPDREPEPVFTGWMFASSPALSAMEHPVYDVWVIDCKTVAPETDEGIASKSP